MVLRKCPQCRSTTDDKYGFCIKCGYEFPDLKDKTNNNTSNENTTTCFNCGFENPEEATFCVKCGMPLIFNKEFENKNRGPFVITYGTNKKPKEDDGDYKKTSRIIIVLGYIFSILGGLIGFIIALYLATRKDPVARKHGKIQLAIFVFYLIIIGVAIGTGTVTIQELAQITPMNLTSMNF